MEGQLRGEDEKDHPSVGYGGGSISFEELTPEDYSTRSSHIGVLLGELGQKHLDEDGLRQYAVLFREVYRDGYRQRYSEIQGMLERIVDTADSIDELDEEVEDCLEILSDNLIKTREYLRTYLDEYGIDTYAGVFKLSDHVDMEIRRLRARMNTYLELDSTGESMESLFTKAADLELKVEKINSDVDEARSGSEKLQVQMVAILGIFAAIVMAFSGGMDILGGAISVSGNSDLSRVVFVVLLCGMIMLNTFAFLMYMILAIIHPQNRAYGESGRTSSLTGGKERKTAWMDRFVGGRFVVAFNSILLIAMFVDALVMVFSN